MITTSMTFGDTSIRVNFVSEFYKALVLANKLARIRATIRSMIQFFSRELNFTIYRIREDWRGENMAR